MEPAKATLLECLLEKARAQVPVFAPMREGEDLAVPACASGMLLKEQQAKPMVALPAAGVMRRREFVAVAMPEVVRAQWQSKPA